MTNNTPPDLNRFRGRLWLLVEIELSPRLRVKEDASDIVQQALLEAHRDWHTYRGQSEAELLGWLKAIVTHKLLNAVRRYGTLKGDINREQVADRLDRSSMRIDRFVANEQTSPSQRAVQNEQIERLTEGLAQLLDGERTAIVLKHFQDWTVAQISEHLGRSPDATAGLLKRGLEKLRAYMPESE